MKGRLRSVLALGALLGGGALAGGVATPPSWLGQRVDVAQTAFCRAWGCELVEVRENARDVVGAFDGTLRRYRLRDGWTLDVGVRPAGWVSTARLYLPAGPGPIVNTELNTLSPQGHRLAAEFLTVLTGRRFSPDAVAACEDQELAEYSRDPVRFRSASGRLLSRWTTPAGWPYRAWCTAVNEPGVRAGWRQD
ncbi:hypothetical protein L1280_002943 [Deinococcus sp. HSC-46F16]|uniref:hypothetical protein n=1 Tax=Deinococcus sp. HSC-46F16 TaxID=2910968 RepID=UPI0020A040C5|nr:hypothetical protein [Deinococcus sp. HSC-46F16]MCP2015767.1 hypothetical protein [Deinococcus sp. HSC-46F16]